MAEIIRIKGGTDNCYLVVEGMNAILVDTSSKKSLDKVIEECDKYDLKLIVLTHTHFDHADNAAELARKYNVPVAIHKADEELFTSYKKQPLMPRGAVGRVVLKLSLKQLRETKVERPENLIYVQEGDDLSTYGVNARVLELPGHTYGSIGLDVDEKHLLVGDALDNWVKPGVAHLYHDLEASQKTAEKIRALGERTVYYGHGKPTKNGKF
ncbi:MAG: MBL fold metallo-hydrolase [Lachnospiraceae bacterium]|nr:MBL fold metallo-hydrolase [Lachnospiraceae bacterium]